MLTVPRLGPSLSEPSARGGPSFVYPGRPLSAVGPPAESLTDLSELRRLQRSCWAEFSQNLDSAQAAAAAFESYAAREESLVGSYGSLIGNRGLDRPPASSSLRSLERMRAVLLDAHVALEEIMRGERVPDSDDPEATGDDDWMEE